METDDKLTLIRDYLGVALPGHPIKYDWYFNRESHHFRVDTPDGRVKHNILLSHDFVDDRAPDLIQAHFREHDLRGHLAEAGKRKLLVTNEGISVEEDTDSGMKSTNGQVHGDVGASAAHLRQG